MSIKMKRYLGIIISLLSLPFLMIYLVIDFIIWAIKQIKEK